MKEKAHKGIEKVSNFINLGKSESINNLFKKGFIYIDNFLEKENCNNLIRDLDVLRGIYPYHLSDKDNFAGVFRSPFLISNNYRDLLLHNQIHKYLKEIFPTNYQLHLSRCVENKETKTAATAEWHRDIPYLHTPSQFPLCISILTFLSPSKEIQIEILLDSHNKNFYNFKDSEILRLNPKPGDAILFDSNLVHRTLPTKETIFYNLFMYSSPVIKPVVDYSSNQIIRKIISNKHRLNEVLEILGYDYLVPKDDLEYINNKLN